jgi:predicted RecB family nuclease
MRNAEFWTIQTNVSREQRDMLEKLANKRGTTVSKLMHQVVDDYLERSEPELNAPVVNKKAAALLKQTAKANKVKSETLIKDFSELSEEVLIRKYHVGPTATAELREYVRNGGT